MPEIRTKLTEGGRIVIPAEYRQALGLQVGDEIILRLEEDGIHIQVPAITADRVWEKLSLDTTIQVLR